MRYKAALIILFVFVCCFTGCGEDKIVTTADMDKNNGTVENETITESEQDKEMLMEEAAPEYDTSIPVSFVDYDALMEQMGDREREAFREYLPVLTGEKQFIVTNVDFQDGETGKFTLYEWFDTIYPIKECDLSFSRIACLDLDDDGTLEVIIPFWSYWDEYLVLHKEGELFYEVVWDAWYIENFNEDVVWYEAQPDLSLAAEAEETLMENGLEVPKDCYIRRVTKIPSKDFYIERVWIDYLVQPENAYKHCEDYYFFYDKETGDFLNCLHDKVSDYEPYEACGIFAHMEDVNFDGREDIVIHNGYTRYNMAYRAWLQKEDGTFVYCPDFLEKMGDYELDFEEQAVIGQWSDGSCKTISWYHFEENEYKLYDWECQ